MHPGLGAAAAAARAAAPGPLLHPGAGRRAARRASQTHQLKGVKQRRAWEREGRGEHKLEPAGPSGGAWGHASAISSRQNAAASDHGRHRNPAKRPQRAGAGRAGPSPLCGDDGDGYDRRQGHHGFSQPWGWHTGSGECTERATAGERTVLTSLGPAIGLSNRNRLWGAIQSINSRASRAATGLPCLGTRCMAAAWAPIPASHTSPRPAACGS